MSTKSTGEHAVPCSCRLCLVLIVHVHVTLHTVSQSAIHSVSQSVSPSVSQSVSHGETEN